MLDSLDLLYIVLAIGIALMSIFFSIVLVYAIFILRDINKATTAIKDSAERVQGMIIKPIKMTHEILKYARPMVEVVGEKIKREHEEAQSGEKKKKKKSKS